MSVNSLSCNNFFNMESQWEDSNLMRLNEWK